MTEGLPVVTSPLSLASWIVLLVAALAITIYAGIVRGHTMQLSDAARTGNRMSEMSIFWVLRWQLTFLCLGCITLAVVAAIEIARALLGQ